MPSGCLLACSTYHRRSLSFSAIAVWGLRNHERALRGLNLEIKISTGRFWSPLYLVLVFLFCVHALLLKACQGFRVFRDLSIRRSNSSQESIWRSPLWIPANGSCPLLFVADRFAVRHKAGLLSDLVMRHICAAFTGQATGCKRGRAN